MVVWGLFVWIFPSAFRLLKEENIQAGFPLAYELISQHIKIPIKVSVCIFWLSNIVVLSAAPSQRCRTLV